MTTTTVTIQPYQYTVLPAEVSLDLQTGVLAAHPTRTMTSDTTVLRVRLGNPLVHVDAFLRAIAPIASRVLTGSSIHDGQGHLNLAADEAYDELGRTAARGDLAA
jgi:hypothetical protein